LSSVCANAESSVSVRLDNAVAVEFDAMVTVLSTIADTSKAATPFANANVSRFDVCAVCVVMANVSFAVAARTTWNVADDIAMIIAPKCR
jgi:hypothetical protein